MKSKMKLSAVLTLSLLLSGCNPEEYYPFEEFVQGDDAFCSQAQSFDACTDMGDRCQAAFLDLEKDDQEPIFAACVSNPGWVDPNAPTEPTDPTDPSDPTDPTDPGNGNGNGNGNTDPDDGVPTLEDAFSSKCQNLDDRFLYVVKLVSKKETKTVKKVKVCHSTDKSEHTIIIACPALKAHAKHHDGDDYLGGCK